MHNSFLVYFVNLCLFRAYLRPSSRGTTVCIQQLVIIILFRWLCFPGWIGTSSNPTRTRDSHIYIWLYLLMMGLDKPETCRVWRNVLRMSFASSWFFFTREVSVLCKRLQIPCSRCRITCLLEVMFCLPSVQMWRFKLLF